MTTPIRILLVDDEVDFLETTSKRLGRRGNEVKTAADCGQALALCGTGWMPDAVVLDVMLPDRSGAECLGDLRRHWPKAAVIMLTGHASMQVGMNCLEQGASDYCLKPIDFEELFEKIQIACKNRID